MKEKQPEEGATLMRLNLKIIFSCFGFACISLTQASAFAASYGSFRSFNPLQVSGGIALPATSTAVHTNPAGLVGAPTALVLQAGAPEVWRDGTYRGGVETGGANYGVSAGVEDQDYSQQNQLNAYYGVGVGNEHFSLGVAGVSGLSHSKGSNFNAGLLISASSSAQVGITARGIDNGVDEWGAGVAFHMGSQVDLVIDAAANSNLDHLEMKPGIKVSGGSAALTLAYATGAREQFADGFSAGASFSLAQTKSLEIQYNAGGPLSKYYAALTLGF